MFCIHCGGPLPDGARFCPSCGKKVSGHPSSAPEQAAKSVAPGLRVVARADDGLVEAMENEQVWAVQFHPESLLLSDDSWLPLFQAFTGRCRRSGSK